MWKIPHVLQIFLVAILLGGSWLFLIPLAQPLSLPRLQASSGVEENQEIVFGVIGEPESLNPLLARNSLDSLITGFSVEGLLEVDSEGEFFPALAKSVPTRGNNGVSSDGKKITYSLQEGVKWSDGQPFTCDDVLFTYEVISNPTVTTFVNGPYSSITSVSCPDSYTVVVDLDSFAVDYRLLFQHVLPRHATGAPKNIAMWDYNTKPIGTGPFRVTGWVPGDRITLAANEHYRDYPQKPLTNRITVKFISSIDDGIAQLLIGNIDILWRVQEEDLARVVPFPSIVPNIETTSSAERLLLNLADPTLDATDEPLKHPHWALGDRAVREAIQYGIDKQAIVKSLLYGIPAVGTSELSTGWARCEIQRSDYNPAVARQILQGAGWIDKNGDGVRECNGCALASNATPLRLTLHTTEGNALRAGIAELLIAMLAEIGIQLDVQYVPSAELFGSWSNGVFRKHGNFDILMYTSTEGVDPHSQMFGYFHSTSMPTYANNGAGYNYTRWTDAAADLALNQAGVSIELTDRKREYQNVCDRIAAEIPHLYLYDRAAIALTRSDIHGYKVNPFTYDTWNAAEWRRSCCATTVTEIPTTGGTAYSDDRSFMVDIPSSSFGSSVVISMTTERKPIQIENLVNVGATLSMTMAYSGTNASTVRPVSIPFTLTVDYGPIAVGSLNEESLALYYQERGEWIREDNSTLDLDHNNVKVTTTRFGNWVVLGKRERIYLPSILAE